MRQVRELNVIIAGVGGQGQLFLSRIITETFLRLGVPSLVAETHGMSQRGGSVVVHVRIGNEVRAPTIPQKLADVMIGMELIEAARYVDYLRDRGVAIVNEKVIVPPGQNVKLRDTDLLAYLKEKPVELLTIKSSQRAVSLGAPLSANVHMFGAFIGLLESVEILGSGVDEVVKDILPRRLLDKNLLLYKLGKEDVEKELNKARAEEIKKFFAKNY